MQHGQAQGMHEGKSAGKNFLTDRVRSLVPTELEIGRRRLNQKRAPIKRTHFFIDATVCNETIGLIFVGDNT